jgi:hypothetical protein
VTDAVAATLVESAAVREGPGDGTLDRRLAAVLLTLLPGALIVYFGFEAGGNFAGSVAFAALLLTQILLVRALAADRPFAGFSRAHGIGLALFGLYTAWTLASGLWSGAEDRALTEFDRALVYLLLLLLFGLMPARRWLMRSLTRGIALGCLLVCGAGLITRVLPQVWPIGAGVSPSRLSYPVTYWNALGILASIGVLLMFGLASDPAEKRAVRALAAASVPILATALLFTFSRGAIGALLIGLVLFLLTSRSTALFGALLTSVPAAAVAVLVAYHAKLLATTDPTTSAAVAQGHHVALVVIIAALAAGAARFLLAPLDRWIGAKASGVVFSRRARRGGAAVALALIVIAALGAGAPSWISKEYHAFLRSAPIQGATLSDRLTSVSSDGRTDLWRIALKAFSSEPLRGTGAGTYEFDFYRYRKPSSLPVVDAHNLYLQTMAELGLVGLLLLLGTLLAILIALARHLRGPDRVLYAALVSAFVAWAIHAGIDWDWEMPVVTAWVFAVGGAALAGRSVRGDTAAWEAPAASRAPVTGEAAPTTSVMGPRRRVPLALALLVTAVIPLLIMLSQAYLQRAAVAFTSGNCQKAKSEAISSSNVLPVRSEPYQIIGYCDMSQGHLRAAVTAMQMAVQQEPGNWQYHYGLAIADSYAGINPRHALTTAQRLDPNETLFRPLLRVLHTASRSAWVKAAQTAARAVVGSGRLTLQ